MAPDLDGSDEPGPVTHEHTAEEGLADADSVPMATPAGETEEPPAPVAALTRVRVLAFAAFGSLLTSYAAIAALLALVTAMATRAHFATSGVLSAALPSWLAAHQVPVSIFGLELGALPLLPTIGVVVITAKAASGAADRLDLRRPGQAGQVIATIAIAHGIAGLAISNMTSQAQVTADPIGAAWNPTFVAALAATIGVARRCGLLTALVGRADAAAAAGLRAGALAVVLLLVAGGAVLTFGLLTSIATARDLFPKGVGNTIGMLLLSIGYLPNAMVAATSFVAGPGFTLGEVAVSPMRFDGGPVPGVPLLAALPEHEAAWWPVLFVVPLTVGIVVGRRLRHVDANPVARLRGVGVATGVVAVCFVLLAGSAGGRLGRGALDPVSMRALALSLALVLWTALPASIAAWFGGARPATAHLSGLIDDEDAEDPEDEEGSELPGPRDAVEKSGEVARD